MNNNLPRTARVWHAGLARPEGSKAREHCLQPDQTNVVVPCSAREHRMLQWQKRICVHRFACREPCGLGALARSG